MEYDGFLKLMKNMLKTLGLEVEKDPETKRWNYETHSLRRGGAQHLARAGWPIHMIQLMGRWGSKTILRYCRDTPLECMNAAKDIAMIAGTCEGENVSSQEVQKDSKV